jgi:hypothetical protein
MGATVPFTQTLHVDFAVKILDRKPRRTRNPGVIESFLARVRLLLSF